MDEHQRSNGIPVTRFTLQSIYAQSDDEKLEFECESGNTNILVRYWNLVPWDLDLGAYLLWHLKQNLFMHKFRVWCGFLWCYIPTAFFFGRGLRNTFFLDCRNVYVVLYQMHSLWKVKWKFKLFSNCNRQMLTPLSQRYRVRYVAK